MAHLMLGVLGSLQVTLPDGSTAKFPSDKTRALFAYLAVEADRPHRREALTGLLWPDEPEQTARHNLRQALFSLRQTIGDPAAHPPYLHITRNEIQFNPASDFALDVASLDTHLAACASHPHARLDACAICAPRLQQVVDLYRGKFLQEFFLKDSAAFEEWALAHREGLHQRALEALTNLATYYEQRGDLGATRRCALRQLELDPWREQAHRQMMRVLALEGQLGAAIAQCETCQRMLAEELGVEPSSETRELYEQIRAGTLTLAVGRWNKVPHESSSLQASTSDVKPRTSSLPTPLTSFIGREGELSDLGRLLADPACRCITLVGPGGIGKTRLALQAASNHRHTFAQGVAFVPLAAINSDEAIVPAIAETLGCSFYGPTSPRIQLFNYLRDQQMLLVLDNVEQLLVEDPLQGNAPELFMKLLQHAAEIKLLLTSREPLNVQGEWVFEVEGLSIPEDDRTEAIKSSAAVALFLQRAQRARVGHEMSAEERPSVARLCHLVDGNPLALELAATWVRTLSVSEIVTEIERNLDFLSSTVRDLPERHRSIRVVFDHSWEMLSAEEQRVLRDLSVFHGRFQRQAAEQVAGASLATLSALVAKSLVRRTATGHYDLHELVRQYAASKLAADASAPSVAERHSRYYLDWLGRSAACLRDHRRKETVSELAAEVDNLRVAWDWAITHHDIARAYQVSTALLYLFELRTWFAEGEILFRNAAEAIHGRGAESKPSADALLAINAMRAHSGYFTFRLGKSAASHAALLPSAKYLRSSTDQFAGTYALWYLGMVCWELGKFAEAKASFQESLDGARGSGERWYETMVTEYLGIVAHDEGEYDRARRSLTEALAMAREMGDPMVISHVLGYLSLTTLALGETAETEKLLHESLSLAQEIGYRSGIGSALDRLGLLAQMTSLDKARTLFTASFDVFKENGDLRNVARVLTHQGYNSFALGDVAGAQRSFVAVLRLSSEGGYIPFALDALGGLAMLWAENSNAERALELVLHILQQPAATHDAKSRVERLRAELETRLTPQQIQAAHARAREQSYDQVVSQVLGQRS
jgi:predicted ATPase/DNA-binding SARP family transcriptional activator